MRNRKKHKKENLENSTVSKKIKLIVLIIPLIKMCNAYLMAITLIIIPIYIAHSYIVSKNILPFFSPVYKWEIKLLPST